MATTEIQNPTPPSGGTVRHGLSFEDICKKQRESLKKIGEWVLRSRTDLIFESGENYGGQHGEMKANIMLAYRHLEDARMRIGKILQAAGDGVSILDK
ncbi:hypothetical protein LCGC14_1236580 [marine sediment metagenome]|uniref:Uncharacterized protein n=1 Tax=marine sediment metagenome TaxID=412755 RepID=A0A0F9LU61_9ZZZZ